MSTKTLAVIPNHGDPVGFSTQEINTLKKLTSVYIDMHPNPKPMTHMYVLPDLYQHLTYLKQISFFDGHFEYSAAIWMVGNAMRFPIKGFPKSVLKPIYNKLMTVKRRS